jgi:hypothetical protein
LYLVLSLIAAETFLPPTFITGLDLGGLRFCPFTLPLLPPLLPLENKFGSSLSLRAGQFGLSITCPSLHFSWPKQVFAGVLKHGIHQQVGIHYTNGNW